MSNIKRRDFLKLSGGAIIGLTAGGFTLSASAQEKVDLDNPTAKALKYVHESTTEGANCDNCMHISGNEGDEWRPCALFQGKLVSSNGWCAGWVKKPGG
ncbi:high-potential iron-sulfur protein [Aliiglaciecola sp. CAU 1673]|uniref:high-potential iron-sulfur protein n=1 Tax=Aliiglaciecola sp. CAU 1673 TaxID=3032595 RepID=UPI0023DA865A|nr:high-potential iron-sulfur protein [Aliiglaciecola sp. CAU 1673]MDF2180174.1 high-potential iron-sulfur protein [Aliiglaciecola sp. CAU 1673]